MKIILILVSSVVIFSSCGHKPSSSERKQRQIDSMNGTYFETIREYGKPIQQDLYDDYKLWGKLFIEDEQVTDFAQVDSLGNIIGYFPILIWDNPKSFQADDSLHFKIKNVDSLTYYVYYYEVNGIKFELEGLKKIDLVKPIDFKKHALIKIPKSEVQGQKELFIKWGYLANVKDSASYDLHTWNFIDANFKIEW